MVSAANSFGLMDGGVDAAITRFFGYELERPVQNALLTNISANSPLEHPLSSKQSILNTLSSRPYADAARSNEYFTRTDNAYKAMWAMLLAVHQHNKASERKINSILCPGLGTGTGSVPFRQAARQMALAYRYYLNPPPYISWQFADKRQAEIRYGGDDGFQFPPEYA